MARWYKRCGADFIHGTMRLTLEEKGAYSLCLDLIYDRGGPIPDDARWLSGICGVSLRKWASIRNRLIEAGKIVAEDGHLMNHRAALEIVSAEKYARNQAESGAKGGRKRAEKAAAAKENNNLGQASLKPIDNDRREEIPLSNDNGAPDPERVMFDHGKAFLTSNGVGPAQAGSLLGKWKRDHGAPVVISALSRAQREGAIEPVSFIEGCLRAHRKALAHDDDRITV